jgi:hypothetical protein
MMLKSSNDVKIAFREKIIILFPALVAAILAFAAAFYFVDPFPPRHITIACGPPESANYNYAQTYREILSREGIMLELVNTAGSAENLKLLGAASGGVDVAFVQGSMKSLVQNTDLMSLGSLFEGIAPGGRRRRQRHKNFDHAAARAQQRPFTKYDYSFLRLPKGCRYALSR